jgi:hypothetical protein
MQPDTPITPWLDSIKKATDATARCAVQHVLRSRGVAGDVASLTARFTTLADALLGDARCHQNDAEAAVEALATVLRAVGPCGAANAQAVLSAAARRRGERDAAAVDPLWRDPGHTLGAGWLDVLAWAVIDEREAQSPSAPESAEAVRHLDAEAHAGSAQSKTAFGTWVTSVEALASLSDRRSKLVRSGETSGGEIAVYDTRGDPVGSVVPGMQEETIEAIQKALQAAFGVAGLRLVRFVITNVQRQHADKKHRGNVRDVRVEGGWSGLAEALGGLQPRRLKEAAGLLQRVRLRTRTVEIGGLLTTYEIRRGRSGGRRNLTISAGPALDPTFRPGSVLVPVPDPAREPPLLGRGTTFAAQLRLQQLWLLEMRRGWKDLLEHHGLILRHPPRCWEPMADRAGLPARSVDKVLSLWRSGSDTVPPFLQVDGDVWTLGDYWRPELEFLIEGAKTSQKGAKRRSPGK